jgi:hypothetical protein
VNSYTTDAHNTYRVDVVLREVPIAQQPNRALHGLDEHVHALLFDRALRLLHEALHHLWSNNSPMIRYMVLIQAVDELHIVYMTAQPVAGPDAVRCAQKGTQTHVRIKNRHALTALSFS